MEKLISHHIIDDHRPRNDKLQAILVLVQETMNARDLLFLEECILLLMQKQLIIGPVFVMLKFVMIFVGLGSKQELEQLCVLGALAFYTGTFMLLTLDVDTEKALHSRNHAAYRSLHRLKTIFHSVFVLKWCLSTHDDMQGANKV